MGVFRTWVEARNPHNQFRFPLISIRSRFDPRKKWVENPPIDLDPGLDTYRCDNCTHLWQRAKGMGKPSSCPRCGSFSIKKITAEDAFNPEKNIRGIKLNWSGQALL